MTWGHRVPSRVRAPANVSTLDPVCLTIWPGGVEEGWASVSDILTRWGRGRLNQCLTFWPGRVQGGRSTVSDILTRWGWGGLSQCVWHSDQLGFREVDPVSESDQVELRGGWSSESDNLTKWGWGRGGVDSVSDNQTSWGWGRRVWLSDNQIGWACGRGELTQWVWQSGQGRARHLSPV